MAEPYLEQLTQLVARLTLAPAGGLALEPRHFFSGAALYANGKICAVLGPAGLAVKLPAEARERLLATGHGAPFRFFAQGPIKREYVLLSESILPDDVLTAEIVGACVEYVVGAADNS